MVILLCVYISAFAMMPPAVDSCLEPELFTCPVRTWSHPSHLSHLQQRVLRGCGVSGFFVWFCVGFVCGLVVLFLLFCLFSVSFGVVLFPFAPLHALALSLTGAQRTDSSFASKKSCLEPEPEAETAIQAPVYNKAVVYCFLCVCVRRTLELIDDAEFDENHEQVGSLPAIHEVLMNTFEAFERNGITASNLGALMEMHSALQRHDAEFNALNFMSVESDADFTEPMEETEIESLLPFDPPSDLHLEELGEPYAPRNPEHINIWRMMQTLRDLSSSDEET